MSAGGMFYVVGLQEEQARLNADTVRLWYDKGETPEAGSVFT